MSRRLGQVFLKSKYIQKKIADYVLGLEGDYFVEIGPGSGAITKYLYDSCKSKLMMVELDERLIRYLNEIFPEAKMLHADILSVDFDDLDDSRKNVLFGNIPYYITSPIILKFLKEKVFSDAVFMIQKEYYETIMAEPCTNKYSCMSALVQSFVSLKKILIVDRTKFYPIPKVDSVVVHMSKNKDCSLDLKQYSLFLRKCFGMPRKTLWNNLKKHFDQEFLEKAFKDRDISMKVRPDEKKYEFFIDLFKFLEN